jgi:hypothetical protein
MFKICSVGILLILLNSCASGYDKINPETISYVSKNIENDVLLEYKYDLLDNKYRKKELKNGVKLIAVKITNNTDSDLVFGNDMKLAYDNGKELRLVEIEKIYKEIKQSPASYLWYLLLSPMQLNKTSTSNGRQQTESSTPIGLVIGPGIAGGNIIVASSANKKFKKELVEFNIIGKVVKKKETIYGLIGVASNSYDSFKIIINKT